MEEAPQNGKESSHSAHVNGLEGNNTKMPATYELQRMVTATLGAS
jgi:hypothetical protein